MTDIHWQNITVKLGDLKPWSSNPRMSTKAQAKRLLESWNDFGQVETIAVSPELNVYDGHQRLSALLAVYGRDYEVDARQSSRELSDEERRKLVVFLHSGAVGDWNWDELANWSTPELIGWGLDADLLKSWNNDANALKEMLTAEKSDPVDAEPQIDRAAELNEKWQVKAGDLFKIGEHRLLCGDSTVKADVERVMQGELCGACVTDSPYGINREGIENDDPEGLQNLLEGVLAVMPIENGVVINFQSPRLFPVWLDAIRKAGHKFERMLWMYKKNDVTFPWRGWIMTSEAILVSSFGTPEWEESETYHHDCYETEWGNEVNSEHASGKPLEVIDDLVKHTSGLVYEPFCGSGTTMVACENLHRKCRAIEISPNYCAVILERMSTAFPELEIIKIQ